MGMRRKKRCAIARDEREIHKGGARGMVRQVPTLSFRGWKLNPMPTSPLRSTILSPPTLTPHYPSPAPQSSYRRRGDLAIEEAEEGGGSLGGRRRR